MFFFVISALLGFIGLIYLWFKTSYGYFQKRGFPGPSPTFPYGNLPNLIFFKRNVLYDWEVIYNQFKGKASVVGAFEMKSPKLMIMDPELIKCVFIKNFKNFHDNEFSKMVCSNLIQCDR